MAELLRWPSLRLSCPLICPLQDFLRQGEDEASRYWAMEHWVEAPIDKRVGMEFGDSPLVPAMFVSPRLLVGRVRVAGGDGGDG